MPLETPNLEDQSVIPPTPTPTPVTPPAVVPVVPPVTTPVAVPVPATLDTAANSTGATQAEAIALLQQKLETALAKIGEQVEQQVQTKLNERVIADARATLKAEYNLTDAQANRLQGDSADTMRVDADALFAAQKKAPKLPPPAAPRLPPGGQAPEGNQQPFDPKRPPRLSDVFKR